MSDFDSIVLTYKERVLLIKLRIKKKHICNIYEEPWNSLRIYGLVTQNYLSERDKEGGSIPDGSISLTDRYYRFCIYERKQKIFRYITPIVVAFTTTVIINLLQELWLPGLISWLQDLF